jgi:hypothetical protein
MTSEKKSNFTALTTVPDSTTLDFVYEGQNYKITKADFFTAMGALGTLTQEGAVTGTPVLDVTSPPDYPIRNLESGAGILTSLSPDNGITIKHSFVSGALGLPVLANSSAATPLIRSLLAGDNVSITVDGDSLQIDAAIGTVPNTVVIQELADFPTPVGNVITLPVGSPAVYVLKGNIDLGANVIEAEGGNSIRGDSASTSSLTSSSASPTVTFLNGGFKASGITGEIGVAINNTGGGAAVRVEGTDTLCILRLLFTSECGTGLEIDQGSVLLNGWTLLGTIVNGLVMTNTGNTGPILNSFNPIGCTGRGIYINGDISVSALRINDGVIGSTSAPIIGNAIEIAAGKTIQGMSFSGDAISSGGNGLKIAGAVAGGLLLENTNILSLANDGVDITGSTISTMIGSSAGITSTGASKSGLKGNAQSDTSILAGGGNITSNAIFEVCNILSFGAGGTPLSGISKKDLKYRFIRAGAAITDSVNVGGFTLDTQTNTVITYQGYDGSNTIYADSLTAPGSRTLVTSTGHTLPAGTSISITGTTSYNGLHTASNVLTNTYEIDVVFVADDATGNYQSGWEKVAGATTDIETIERFNGTNDNEIESLDAKTIPVTYSATISGEKVGSPARLCQFALFLDSGSGFVKVDGEATIDVINRIKSTTLRVPFEMSKGGLATLYCRNTEGTDDYISDAFSVDIGIS